MKHSLERKITVGHALGLVMLCFVGMLSLWQLHRYERDGKWSDHTREVIASVADLSAAFKDAEAGARGFVISGDDRFLEPFAGAVERMARVTQRIASLTADTAIVGYADLLLDPERSDSERLNNVNIIRRNAEHLLALISGVLDLSKIEAGEMTIESIACSPCQIVADVASTMRVRAVEKGLNLEVKIQGPVPRTIRTDPTRLRQVLINLVGKGMSTTGHKPLTYPIELSILAGFVRQASIPAGSLAA